MNQRRSAPYLLALTAMLFVIAGCGSATTTSTDEPKNDESDSEPERDPVPADAVMIKADQGPGWRLLGAEVGRGHPHEVAVATTDRGLDRAADDGWFEARPTPEFAEEILIVLAASVSGSCPGIIFNGLSITDDRVFGLFEPGPLPDGATDCNADANPIAFVFLVERHALPEVFTVSVEQEVICGGCERAEVIVDLGDEAALELALWGTGTFDIVIDGSPPAEGTANVFRWADQAALMLPAGEFTNLPRWIQAFPGDVAITIEAFVVDCGGQGCAEECDDESCQDLTPLDNICSYQYEPEPFIDRTATITWTGTDCEITSTPQRAGN